MSEYLCNLVIPGAAKSGSTSLHAILNQHPNVCMSRPKESQFFSFDMNYRKGPEFHNALFQKANGVKFYGDASQCYMVHPHARARIKADLLHPKIIFVLRDPLKRLWSHYKANHMEGWEPRDLTTAVDELGESTIYNFNERISMHKEEGGYLVFSRYRKWIGEWKEDFGEDNVLLLSSDELYFDQSATMSRCTEFLGLPPLAPIKPVHANKTSDKGKRPPSAFSHIAGFLPTSLKQNSLYRGVRSLLSRTTMPELPRDIPSEPAEKLREQLFEDIRFYEETFSR